MLRNCGPSGRLARLARIRGNHANKELYERARLGRGRPLRPRAPHAQVTEADVGINPTFEQTGPTTVTSTGGFFSARAFVSSAGDFDAGTLTYGGPGSPEPLSYVPVDVAWEFGDANAVFSNLQLAYPTGGYQFDLTGGSQGPASVSLNFDGDAYANTPQLSAASFSSLQGLNAATPITLDFNPMAGQPECNAGREQHLFFIDTPPAQQCSVAAPCRRTRPASRLGVESVCRGELSV